MTGQKLLGALYAWGADPDTAIRRLVGDEEFYLSLVKRLSDGMDIQKIRELNDSGDLNETFMLVHRMKGSAADLSLIPLFEILDELTEELRPRKHGLSREQMDRLENCAEGFLDIVSANRTITDI